MTINNPNIELVIAVLNGIDVDCESMQYIIEKVGMIDQMKSQLGIETEMPDVVIDQIAKDIYIDLDNEGVDILETQTYGINDNEIYLRDIELDLYRVQAIIKDVLRSHFKSME
jgi:regulator of protease activity HflC (stomatin/prohibitin superfamily)